MLKSVKSVADKMVSTFDSAIDLTYTLLFVHNGETSILTAVNFISDYNNRKTSVDSTTSSEFSDIDFSSAYDVSSDKADNDEASFEVKKILHQKKPIKITIKLNVTDTTFSVWETVLNPDNNTLYVALPTVLLPEASKQSFITLLEFAEEKLDVDAVVLCMRKDRLDRQNLVRTFLFLGFQPLSPKSPLAPPQSSDNLFLIYNIEE
ncbi:Ornithine decarboxylase antizyme [Pseudolycoriella hygida]|uniref:Ornithine decarboxylase antizyme n=1 Tax=Pseudolycoriella hygida TaxID=35572 RepID=A0A9Q0N076_9DIPT|nr:Ornithine decarboxylase antizyme [Pseudolycoriella hygida]